MSKGKVLLAMSGGLDSSMAAILLQEQGYELIGATYRPWDSISNACMEKETGCCSVDAIFEAKNMAEKLGFPHYIIDFRKEFRKTVIENFIDEYLNARTPNPCILCNAYIKWGDLLAKADELGCEFVATGHYAKVKTENGKFFISKGIDDSKDQSYFLWMLSQENLKRTLFPLGIYLKDDIRKMAKERSFEKIASKRESQEICFIPDNDYRRFLKEEAPDKINNIGAGNFISTSGSVLGKHKGYPFYTIGQRKGLEVAAGYPLYVVEINKNTNEVILGNKDELNRKEMWVDQFMLTKYDDLPSNIEVSTKIRYRNKGHQSRLNIIDGKLKVEFYENVSAIAPGQSAVFYEGDDLIGGGIIGK